MNSLIVKKLRFYVVGPEIIRLFVPSDNICTSESRFEPQRREAFEPKIFICTANPAPFRSPPSDMIVSQLLPDKDLPSLEPWPLATPQEYQFSAKVLLNNQSFFGGFGVHPPSLPKKESNGEPQTTANNHDYLTDSRSSRVDWLPQNDESHLFIHPNSAWIPCRSHQWTTRDLF